MKKYWAKSNPPETIQEHTDNLLVNYRLLKETYPGLNMNWDMLYLVCLHHDLGKMNLKFQNKIISKKYDNTEIPHGILSLSFFNSKKLIEMGYSELDIKIMAIAIAYHHDRELKYSKEDLANEIENLKIEASHFEYDKVEIFEVKKISRIYFNKEKISRKNDGEDAFFQYVMLKGMLNRIDYAASAGIDVENKNDFLSDGLDKFMVGLKEKNPKAEWNELQKYMEENRDENIIAIAQTGMGKTEAGLLWIGDNKGFFTLPLRTAINAIYKRITENIVESEIDKRVALLHGDTYSKYLEKSDDESLEADIDEYYNRTKQMALPLTVCTLDQIFDFVFRYRGFEPKLATLAYSKVVIDEIQMYSPDLLAYLINGLSYITKVGGKFAVLTATLPSIVLDLMKKENIPFIEPRIFVDNKRIRHSIMVLNEEINIERILEQYNDNKVLVVCNTVKRAQEIYKGLAEVLGGNRKDLNLLHSRFLKKDRAVKEESILTMGTRESAETGIWIGTQIVEASLDIDFDVLLTELSDLNGLFQRMGRCYRNRELDKEYNCYVFDGGERKCSGVGKNSVIDPDIFILSKNALRTLDGTITEQIKVDMIKNIYTMENLLDTDYFKIFQKSMEFVKMKLDNEMKREEVLKEFRNIHSVNIMPEKTYQENKGKIEEILDFINQPYNKELTSDERKDLKKEKARLKTKLYDYLVNVNYQYIEKNCEKVERAVGKYERFFILKCDYSEEVGVEFPKSEKKNREAGQEDSFF